MVVVVEEGEVADLVAMAADNVDLVAAAFKGRRRRRKMVLCCRWCRRVQCNGALSARGFGGLDSRFDLSTAQNRTEKVTLNP